jgi:hypothetical protein
VGESRSEYNTCLAASARIIKEIETVQTASRSQSTHLSEVEDEMLQLKEEQQEYDTE